MVLLNGITDLAAQYFVKIQLLLVFIYLGWCWNDTVYRIKNGFSCLLTYNLWILVMVLLVAATAKPFAMLKEVILLKPSFFDVLAVSNPVWRPFSWVMPSTLNICIASYVANYGLWLFKLIAKELQRRLPVINLNILEINVFNIKETASVFCVFLWK